MPLPPDFWFEENKNLKAVLLPMAETLSLEGVAFASANLARAGIAIDNSLVLSMAARWAREYTDVLLRQLGTTNEGIVGELVANWAETPGATLQSLRERLAPVLGGNDARARTIAVTEVTRATTGGEALVYEEIGIGRLLVAPPAHPNCRCGTRVTRIGKFNVVVWSSNKDELAECHHEILVPWGDTVIGCRAMDGYVISDGEKLGTHVRKI